MINRKQFTQAAKRILKHQRGLRDPQIIHPQREWLLGVFFALLLFIGLALWSYSTYTTYSDTSSIGAVTGIDGVVVYRESLVEAALEEFSGKQNNLSGFIEDAEPYVPEPEVVIEQPTSTTLETEATSTPRADINVAPALSPN